MRAFFVEQIWICARAKIGMDDMSRRMSGGWGGRKDENGRREHSDKSR